MIVIQKINVEVFIWAGYVKRMYPHDQVKSLLFHTLMAKERLTRRDGEQQDAQRLVILN